MSKGDVTRERIVAQAAPIFNQRGYAGCSMQDVMEATGLEKGGIYRHFSSKEELAAEAFQYSWRKAMELRWGDDASVTGAIAVLLNKVNHFVRVPSPVPGGCPLMNTAIDADDTNPLLRRLAKDAIREWKARLSSIVEEGIGSGEVRGDVQPTRVANAIVATLEGALMISRLEGTRQAMLDAEETLKGMIEGLACHASASLTGRPDHGSEALVGSKTSPGVLSSNRPLR